VGNRAWESGWSQLVEFPYLKAAAGLLFMAPYIPMLFMGEEYAEENPFLFFTDYQDPALKKAVAEGRREEFASFGWQDIPNPQDESTFFRSKLTPATSGGGTRSRCSAITAISSPCGGSTRSNGARQGRNGGQG